jgi:predicted AlkP superfamily phosphohydrolase/phosphomutase
MPISSPSFYSVYLARLLDSFATLGLAEDTWALNERVIDEKAFLEQAYAFHDERKKMWFRTLRKQKKGFITCVFDLSDRLQHMFFRYLIDTHTANLGKDTIDHKEALHDMYREMDRLVEQTLKYVDDKTAFFVISDHGFKPFLKGVNTNTWLLENGYLSFGDGERGEYLQSVDWSKTRAYALGLGGIYINKKGRERQGIVDEADCQALKDEISAGLLGLKDEHGPMINKMFDVERDFTGPYRFEGPDLIVGFREGTRVSWDCARGLVTPNIIENNEKSWSGDHCMDPDTVPGILFSNRPVPEEHPRIMDMGPTVLDLFGVKIPAFMTGKNILEEPTEHSDPGGDQ